MSRITTDLPHQAEVFDKFKDRDKVALFMEQGTGKSRVIIKIAEHHYRQRQIQAVVIITTSALVMNWSMLEIPIHHDMPHHTFIWKKTKKIRRTDLLYYLIVNVDATPTGKFHAIWKQFLREYPNYMLAVDESTLVKSHDANRTKAVIYMAARAKIKLISSGFPITHSPMDLYSQFEVLGHGTLGHNSFYSFRNRYATVEEEYNGVRSYRVITAYKNIGELTAKVGKLSVILKKKDCLNLPDKIYERIHTEFSPEQAAAYNDLVTRAITYIDEHEITASTAFALINRLLQICCGQIKVGDKYLSIPTPRLEALKELVDQSPDQIMVWTSYVQSSIDAATALGPLAIRIPRGLSPTALYSQTQAFVNGKYKVMIANPATLGHGLTFVNTATVYYLSNTWNLEHRIQSEDRMHRYGQTRQVVYTDLITLGTIEERVVQVLREKKALADIILTRAKLKSLITGVGYGQESNNRGDDARDIKILEPRPISTNNQ